MNRQQYEKALEASTKRNTVQNNQQQTNISSSTNIEMSGIRLPKKFATYSRNNHETWQPALFLEEPDDPQKICHYAKSLVYPANMGIEYSPEEIKARRCKYKMDELKQKYAQQQQQQVMQQQQQQQEQSNKETLHNNVPQVQQNHNIQVQEIGTIKTEAVTQPPPQQAAAGAVKYQAPQQTPQYYVQHQQQQQQQQLHHINNNHLYYQQQHETQLYHQQQQHHTQHIQTPVDPQQQRQQLQHVQQQYHINHYEQQQQRYQQKYQQQQQPYNKQQQQLQRDPENEEDDQDTEDEQQQQYHQQIPQQHTNYQYQQQQQQVTTNQQNYNTALDAEGDLEDQIEASTIRFSMHTPNKGSQNKTLKIKFKKERPAAAGDTPNGNNYSAYTIERICQPEVCIKLSKYNSFLNIKYILSSFPA